MRFLKVIILIVLIPLLATCATYKESKKSLFEKSNLIPWSIVGFDVKERTPKQRLEMLERLGYKQYAYGYRPKHIPTMKQEWELAKEKGIEVKATLQRIPTSPTTFTDAQMEDIEKMLDKMEEDDDVQAAFNNIE